MRASPGFCGMKGSTFPDRVLWSWISAICARCSFWAIGEAMDCSRKLPTGGSKQMARDTRESSLIGTYGGDALYTIPNNGLNVRVGSDPANLRHCKMCFQSV